MAAEYPGTKEIKPYGDVSLLVRGILMQSQYLSQGNICVRAEHKQLEQVAEPCYTNNMVDKVRPF